MCEDAPAPSETAAAAAAPEAVPSAGFAVADPTPPPEPAATAPAGMCMEPNIAVSDGAVRSPLAVGCNPLPPDTGFAACLNNESAARAGAVEPTEGPGC
jgi:hypothetical protein